jgi:hypothetical protein
VAAVQSQVPVHSAPSWLPVARNSQHFHLLELASERAEDRSRKDPLHHFDSLLAAHKAVRLSRTIILGHAKGAHQTAVDAIGDTAAACNSKGRGKIRDVLLFSSGPTPAKLAPSLA